MINVAQQEKEILMQLQKKVLISKTMNSISSVGVVVIIVI